MIPFSVLDLSPIRQGSDAADALRSTLDLARHVERWGYQRFWLAEHHNMTGIASAATAVVIGHVAQGTSSIRVGAGGIMLPNHSPLVIAEQFGTLETLYPGRIDLGLGRAPGTDQRTAAALRRSRVDTSDAFPQDVAELQAYFQDAEPQQAVRAVPGMGLKVPLWILGSSLFGAQLAAVMGLPYAFASHFAPQQLLSALRVYRANFRPSAVLDKPHAMVGLNVFAADTEPEAQKLFTSLLQAFINLRRGRPGQLPPPVDSMDGRITEYELAEVESMLACSIVGNPQQVEEGLRSFIAEVQPDELMVTAQIFDHTARLRSYELLAQARTRLSLESGTEASAG
ncbi:LLM class flavin-dependent oxidoreductase [Myxococcus sp. K38C18041901]|uniref:LLM class flavin-dependent oxidoreductase n=1 Tax=Myxococcus guangdongensis TaxID=2906760 RepID=UPI0020A75D7E|nr:LLM class flavin-dependent oxidoreductase [Myxococcus guangdongensis]MCP3064529.1 LLM class flavin-dependent oxidoreductase [Myxococcus guangdongensis]